MKKRSIKSIEEIEAVLKIHKQELREKYGADVDIIWNTVQEDLSQLENIIRKILKDIRKNM